MKKYLYMAVAAIAVLSSCSNDNEFEPNQTGKQALVFTATMEGSEGTRATYDATKKCAAWEAGDQISINGVSYSAETAGTTTTFKATTEGEEATGETYNAYFPASLYKNGTPTLPANVSETWAEGKFNMPMYASGTTTDLKFKNLCGVLKITVKSDDQLASVKRITVSSIDKAVSGAFTVNASTNAAELTEASKPENILSDTYSDAANTLTVTYTDAVATDATGKVFYVAIPAQTYKELSIAISDGTVTKVMTTTKDKEITVVRSKIYPINFNSYLITTNNAETSESAGISGNKVKWIQLWKDGPKFAEYNVGVTDGKAESYGGYYCWGGTNNNDPTFESSEWLNDHYDGSSLSDGHDTANNIWGYNWKMPEIEDFQNLVENCYAERVVDEDFVPQYDWDTPTFLGIKFTGKGAYASNSIFLPAAGDLRYDDYEHHFYYYGYEEGRYWSSTLEGDHGDYACILHIDRYSYGKTYGSPYFENRGNAYSVRAVLAE